MLIILLHRGGNSGFWNRNADTDGFLILGPGNQENLAGCLELRNWFYKDHYK
jgi:hypothetical protein